MKVGRTVCVTESSLEQFVTANTIPAVIADGVLHTSFRVTGVNNIAAIASLEQERSTEPGRVEQAREWIVRALAEPKETGSLFGDLAPERHRDDG